MSHDNTKRIFLVAGEHSGDALGAALMKALRKSEGSVSFEFAGVGGDDMAQAGMQSLFPLEDVAVMGPAAILPALPRIIRRVYQTVDAAIAFKPDLLVIIDSPEFSHPIAKRVRRRAPHIKIANYVSPSVWAWRPSRAKRMRAYVDHILALLPFEPDAHRRLGGPQCTYVGHPLIEKLNQIERADADALRARLGIAEGAAVLAVLPGSRRSEVAHLVQTFGDTVRRLKQDNPDMVVVIPAVAHVKAAIETHSASWPQPVHIVDSAADKYAVMKLATAALAASGTVTLELALAQTPSVVGYRTDAVTAAVVRKLVVAPTVVLPNLVLGENVYPEFMQNDCVPDVLAKALAPLIANTPTRQAQLSALTRVAGKMRLPDGSPSDAAARVVLAMLGNDKR